MTIDPSGMAHVMSILTNLYANAPLAVLREYATNARDSHVAAGSNRPIEVNLPTDLNPSLVIRDYGVGLSEQEIIEVYARYGASTKRDTDDQVGAFGLGCKSAFTLGQQFVVTAVKDGRRTVALFALGADGAGGVTILNRADTAEPNGVLISIGVPDAGHMRRAATGFFSTWRPGTVHVDGQEPSTVFAGAFPITDRVHLAAPGNLVAASGMHVVMGGVGYLVSDSLMIRAARDDQSLARLVGSLRANATRLYVQVDIGAVDITPSREALRDTDKTLRSVKLGLLALRDGIVPAVQAELDSQPDMARAGFVLATVRPRLAGLHDLLPRRGFTWQGQQIPVMQALPLPSYTLDRSRPSRPALTATNDTQVALEALAGALVVTGVPKSGGVLRAARRYLIEHHKVTCLIISAADSGGAGWLAFGPGLPIRTLAYRDFKEAAAQVVTVSAGRAPTRYQTTPADTTRSINLTGPEIADLTGEIIALPGHLVESPLGRKVSRDRTLVALNYQQTCAALIRRVPAVLDGEAEIRSTARELMAALTETDRALLDAQRIVTSRERIIARVRQLLHPVLGSITGNTLQDLLSEFDQAKHLVAASPGRMALLTQAQQLYPLLPRHPAPPAGEELLDQQLPLLALALRSGNHYSPVTLTDAETTHLLTYVNQR